MTKPPTSQGRSLLHKRFLRSHRSRRRRRGMMVLLLAALTAVFEEWTLHLCTGAKVGGPCHHADNPSAAPSSRAQQDHKRGRDAALLGVCITFVAAPFPPTPSDTGGRPPFFSRHPTHTFAYTHLYTHTHKPRLTHFSPPPKHMTGLPTNHGHRHSHPTTHHIDFFLLLLHQQRLSLHPPTRRTSL